uniref:Ig-like domain-containing protein n=1 Tax=Pantoea sp. GbtcB22 TaxID=2824767 RepID=UPI0020C5E530
SIDSALDNAGPVTGSLSSGASTDDTTPTLRGTGPASSVITLRYKLGNGSYTLDSVSVDADGNWSWTPDTLAKGSWTFEVQKAGQSDWSSFQLTIDPDLDRYPTIDSALDNAGPVTGSLSSGASTDDTTPTLRGTGPANSVITLRYKLGNGGYSVDSASVDADGNWSWTPNTLAKGSWTFEVQKAGQSGWSSFKLTIDPALDLKPTIDSAWDDFGAVTGSLTSGDTTDDNTPTLRGTGVAGTIIHFQNGLAGSSWVNVGSTVVKADGTWEWTSPVLSKNGTWEFHAKAQNGEVISDWTGKFILKYVAAAGPVITDALDNVGPVTGSLNSGASTDDSTPTLRGTGPANSVITLRYKLGSGSYASTTVSVDNAGNWSWTPDTLAKGSWTFEVQNAGQNGWNSFQLTIDPDLERYPTIDSALDNAGPVTGSLSSGASTDDTTPTLRGTGPANGTITLRYKMDGGNYASTTVSVDNAGNWSWTPDTLTKGSWTFEVQKAGQSDWSSFTLTIDPDLDRYPTIDSALDNAGPVTGSLSSGASTDDTTPTLHGSGPASSTITLRYKLGSGSYASTTVSVDGNGKWTWTPDTLAEGSWTFEVQKAGQSDWSSFTLTIDPNLDRNATIDSALDNAGPVTGSLSSGASTDDTTPTLHGSGPASSTITLRYKMDGGSYASTTVSVDVNGTWSWTPDTLTKGSWTFEVQKAGQSDWSSFTLTIDPELDRYPTIDSALDNEGPVTDTLRSGDTTDDSTPTLRGTGVANSVITLRYKLDSGSYASTTVNVDGSGKWTWTPDTLASGSWTFEVQKAGQNGWSSFTLTIDPTVDHDAVITSAWDDFGAVTGTIANGGITDDSTPTLRGTGPANSSITLKYSNGDRSAGIMVKVDASGNWTWTAPELEEGHWTFEVKKDGQENWSRYELTIDANADRNASIDSAFDNVGPVTGSLSSGATTDDTTPTLHGTGPANSVITLRYKLGNGGYTLDSASVDADGNWSWTPKTLAKGNWTFEVQKASQNDWSSFTLTIDPTVDRNATIDYAYDNFGDVKGLIARGGITDDATPTLSGTGPANSVISLRYKLGSGTYITTSVSVDASGNWSWTPDALAKGSWTFEVQRDGQSDWKSFQLTIEPTADRKPIIESAWDDFGATTGLIANGGTTDDSTPTLRGTGAANSTILLRYFRLATMYEDTINVDASGNWTWTAPELIDGQWTFEVKKQGDYKWNSYELTIDSNADRDATIDSALDNAGPVTGSLASGATTDDTTPTLRGSGPANSVITLRYKLGNDSYASTTVNVDGSGKWTWTSSALAKGSWTFEVQKAGQSDWSRFQLTIDPTLDMQPIIDDAWDNFGAVTGSLKSGDTTDDSTPTLRGRGVAGTIIHIERCLSGMQWASVGSTVVKADGTWEWTSPALSSSNTWNFQARAQTGDHYSAWSDKFVVEYVAAAPGAPVITDAFDDFGTETGSLASGDTTDDQTPTLRGTALANSVVMIRAQHASGEKIYSVKASADGNWSWTPDKPLAKGDWDFQVKKSGAESWGQTFELNLDRGPVKSSIIDFEEFNAGDVNPENQYWFEDNFNFRLLDFMGDQKFSHVVDTPDDAPDIFGDKCFVIGEATVASVAYSTVTGTRLYDNFKCDIWNRANYDIRIEGFYLSYKKNGNPQEFTIIIKAGEVLSLNMQDYFEDKSLQPEIYHISFKFQPYMHELYIDNLYIEYSPNTFRPFVDNVENLVHVLDGVDALTEHAIIGSETQVDTLQLTGKDQLLDLSQHQAEIQSVEIFDIRGSGDNTLKIDLDALLHYGEKDLFIEDGKTQLMINGDAGDVVQLKDILPEGSDISEWQHQQGTVTVAGVEYEVYSHGDDAELLVQQGVKTELI